MERNSKQFEYDPISPIGRGSFGKVFKSYDKLLKKDVALKVIKLDHESKEEENVKFFMELKHENIVNFYGYFTENNRLYIIMDFCQNDSLRIVISKKEPLTDAIIKQWTEELIHVMLYLSKHEIVHNDIKPENILISDTNSILVVDVGEAQLAKKILTMSHRAGTGIYISPERANGASASTASDIWSCGIVIYELIHLEWPFQTLDEFGRKNEIKYSNSPMGLLFRPIIRAILTARPENRPKPENILVAISNPESSENSLSVNPTEESEDTFKGIQDYLPRQDVKNYVDLIDLKQIDDALKLNSILLLTGFAGAGKSTLANKYAKEFSRSKQRSVVVWFYSDDQSKIDNRLQKILIDNLRIDKYLFKNMSQEERLNSINKHIKFVRHQHLFVFDNIDEDQMETIRLLSNTIPDNLKLIMTSRNVGINSKFNIDFGILKIGKFNSLQIKRFLVDKIGAKLSKKTLETIYKELFIKHFDGQITPYLLISIITSLELQLDTIGIDNSDLGLFIEQLKNIKTSEYIMKTFDKNPECEEFLSLVAYLDPDEISIKILNQLMPESVYKALKVLENYMIVERLYIKNSLYVKIHRITMDAIEEKVKENVKLLSNSRRKIFVLFNEMLTNIEQYSEENWSIIELIYMHLKKIGKLKIISREEITILDKIIIVEEKYKYNWNSVIYFKIKKYESLKEIYKDQQDQTDIATILASLGETYCNLGDQPRAIKLFTEALEMRRRIFKDQPNHPLIADCLFNLAVSYRSLKEFSKAIQLNLEAFMMRRKAYEHQPNHPDIASSLNNLAVSYGDLGDHEKAKRWHTEALEMRREIYKDQLDHPEIACSLNDLAASCSILGEQQTAIKLYQEALEIRRRLYKHQPDHPDIAQSLHCLSISFKTFGDQTKALELEKEALEMRRKIYKDQPNHPDIASSLSSLASLCKDSGDLVSARKLFQEAQEILLVIHKGKEIDQSIILVQNSLNSLT